MVLPTLLVLVGLPCLLILGYLVHLLAPTAEQKSRAANDERQVNVALQALDYKTLPSYTKHGYEEKYTSDAFNSDGSTEVTISYTDARVLSVAPARLKAAGWQCEDVTSGEEVKTKSLNMTCYKGDSYAIDIFQQGPALIVIQVTWR